MNIQDVMEDGVAQSRQALAEADDLIRRNEFAMAEHAIALDKLRLARQGLMDEIARWDFGVWEFECVIDE